MTVIVTALCVATYMAFFVIEPSQRDIAVRLILAVDAAAAVIFSAMLLDRYGGLTAQQRYIMLACAVIGIAFIKLFIFSGNK